VETLLASDRIAFAGTSARYGIKAAAKGHAAPPADACGPQGGFDESAATGALRLLSGAADQMAEYRLRTRIRLPLASRSTL
jgi:hypothetical protein